MARVLGLDIEDHVVRGALVRTSFGRVEPLQYLEANVRYLPEVAAGPMPVPPAPADVPASFSGAQGAPLDEPIAENADPLGAGFGAPSGQATTASENSKDDDEKAVDLRREAIAEILSQIRPPPDQVIIGLDGKEASIRTVEVPAGAAKKGRIGEVLPFELDDLVPFDVTEAVVDHQLINTDGPVVRVLATAVPKEKVQARIDELQSLGVDPRGIPVGAAALDGLIALVEGLELGGPYLIIEVERDNTEICVLAEGVCTFARSLAFGQEDFTHPRRGRRAVAAILRTLGAYRAGGGNAPTRAFLAGEGVLQAYDIQHALAPAMQTLGTGEALPLELLSLPHGSNTPETGQADDFRGRFARAAALAGRAGLKGKRIDLRQGEFAQKRAMGALRKHMRLVVLCSTFILGSMAFATYARYSVLSAENEALSAQLRETTEAVFDEATTSVERAQSLLESGQQVQDPLPTMDAYDVLDAITAAIPQELEHKTRRLTIEIDDEARNGRFDLQGTVASIAERDTIAANLESHECFRDLEKGPTSPGPQNEGLNYRLEVNIVCPGDEPEEPPTRRGRRDR